MTSSHALAGMMRNLIDKMVMFRVPSEHGRAAKRSESCDCENCVDDKEEEGDDNDDEDVEKDDEDETIGE